MKKMIYVLNDLSSSALWRNLQTGQQAQNEEGC